MKKSIVKIGIVLVVMMCMLNVVVNAVGTVPPGTSSAVEIKVNTKMIIIGAIQALLPILVLIITVARLLINLSKIKKIENEEEKSKKKTRTIIELCIWIGVLYLIFMLSPMLSIYINMNRTIM